jgi:hypothetical protein
MDAAELAAGPVGFAVGPAEVAATPATATGPPEGAFVF